MKKKPSTFGIVYSTDPDFRHISEVNEDGESLKPAEQKLKIRLEKKHRAGKTVSLVEGFIGNENDREEIVKKLKSYCGTGGSAKDGEILVQGDQREKILQWLIKNGYSQTKKQ